MKESVLRKTKQYTVCVVCVKFLYKVIPIFIEIFQLWIWNSIWNLFGCKHGYGFDFYSTELILWFPTLARQRGAVTIRTLLILSHKIFKMLKIKWDAIDMGFFFISYKLYYLTLLFDISFNLIMNLPLFTILFLLKM